VIWGNEEPAFGSEAQMETMISLMMGCYNEIVTVFNSDSEKFENTSMRPFSRCRWFACRWSYPGCGSVRAASIDMSRVATFYTGNRKSDRSGENETPRRNPHVS
jgi:hypothetical protein